MKGVIAKNIGIGFLVGLIANILGCCIYILLFTEYDIATSLQIAKEQGVLGNIIALGAVLNLVAFFLFLKGNRYYRARGVILATIIAALLIVWAEFF